MDNSFKIRINQVITEELGISDALHKSVYELETLLKKEVNSTKLEMRGDVGVRSGVLDYDFLNKTMHVFWNAYYFQDYESYENFTKTHVMLNGFVFKSRILFLSIIYINHKLLNGSLHDTVGHEMEHAFQTMLMKKDFGGSVLYGKIKTNLHSNDTDIKSVAELLYVSLKSEQEAMVNGCYNELSNTPCHPNNIDNLIYDSECCAWLRKAYQNYNYAKKMENNQQFVDKLYQYFGLTYQKFMKICVNSIRNFERRIARLTMKIKTDFLNEHVKCSLEEYFLIHD